MAPKEVLTADDNVKLLLSAIKHLGGKIDFAQVARDCNIISAGAAAKRYSRLLKAHNIVPVKAAPKDDIKDPGLGGTGNNRTASDSTKGETKKRKSVGTGSARGKATKKVKQEAESEPEPEPEIEDDDHDNGEEAMQGVKLEPDTEEGDSSPSEVDQGVKLEPDTEAGDNKSIFGGD